MRNKMSEANVINLKKRRYAKKYKAIFSLLTRIKMFLKNKGNKPNILKNYKKTINH